MASMFTGLYIAGSGLNAYQHALNITAHNAANMDTKGYCRQYVDRTAADALRLNSREGMLGMGVRVNGVNQYRNEFYDYQYWNNNQRLGLSEGREYYMYQIENYFKGSIVSDTNDSTSGDDFVSIFDKFHSSLQEVKKQNGSMAARTSVISQGQTVAQYFNDIYANLQNLQTECNMEVKNVVTKINTIGEQIASLNKQINAVEMSGGQANDLRDARALLVDELSGYVPVSVKEADVPNSGDPDFRTGATTYEVQIAGQSFVNTFEFNTINLVARTTDQKVNQCDVDGLFDLEWSNGNSFNLEGGQMGGHLKALLDIRDGDNNQGFKGTMADVDVAKKTITIKDSNIQDVMSLNIPPNGRIQLGSAYVEYDSFTVTKNADGSYEYTFQLDSKANLSDNMKGKDAIVGSNKEYMGVPYYMSQMNQFLRSYSKAYNEYYEGNEDMNGNKSGNFFTCKNSTSGLEQHMSDFDGSFSSEFAYCDGKNENTSYYLMTAGNFTVAGELLNDPSRLATTKNIKDGVDQYDVIDNLIALSDQNNLYRGSSPRQFLQCILTDVSMDANRASTLAENYDNIVNSIDTKRRSVSGVDQDEEGVDMVKFKNAYNLCSRIITTMTELYDRLILETGV